MTKLTASEFDNEVTAIRQATASLKSCLRSERANEASILRSVVTRVCGLELARKNDRLLERRANAILYANRVLADCGV